MTEDGKPLETLLEDAAQLGHRHTQCGGIDECLASAKRGIEKAELGRPLERRDLTLHFSHGCRTVLSPTGR